ncbi:MAG: hypothetical protein ACUVRM_00575 [Bacillota bacterium]
MVLRRVAMGFFLLATAGLGLFLGRRAPAWTHLRVNIPDRPFGLPVMGQALTVEELKARFAGLRLLPSPRPAEETLFPGERGPSIDLAGLLAEVHASIRATENAHREAAAREMAAWRAGQAEARLAAARQAQEESLAVQEREMAAQQEQILADYREELRRETLPRLSAIQMELTLTPDKKRQEALTEEMLRLTAAMEEKMACRGRELAEERRRALETLREEARRELERLAAVLEEQGFFSADGLTLEENSSAWQQEDRRCEAALLARWSAKED